MDHFNFISRTDNKSLFNQIKFLVNCAQDSYQNDLTARREHLRQLLDVDEKVYEDEFIGKIKSRVDENIQERQRSLLAMKKERTKENERFVAEKKLHQNMDNCLEIREELRRKDYRETQLCQLEQMDEKLRAIAREKKDDQFWLTVQNRIAEETDRRQEYEKEVKQNLQANQCRILNKQLEEHRQLTAMDLQHDLDAKIALTKKLNETSRKELEKAHMNKMERKRDVRESMNRICEQKELQLQEDELFEDVFHEEAMRQVRKEMEEAAHKHAKVKEAVLDYLNYVKKFKAFEDDYNKKRDQIADEVGNRFFCYKDQPKKGKAEQKRLAAVSTHKVLLRQICEEAERKAKLEAYERENKIIENRFARLMVKDKLKEREMIRSGLDSQLKVLNRLKAEQEKKFGEELNRAEEDKLFCEQLLEKHKSDGCDYLPPHPNWKLVACYKNSKLDGKGGAK